MFAELEFFIAEILAHPVLGPIVLQPEWTARFASFEKGMGWLHVAGTCSACAIEVEDRVREIVRSRRGSLQDRLQALHAFTGSLDAGRLDREVRKGAAAALRGEAALT